MSTWEEAELTSTRCRFSKHRGELWFSVIQTDRDYVRWILENINIDDVLRDALTWGMRYVPDRIGS